MGGGALRNKINMKKLEKQESLMKVRNDVLEQIVRLEIDIAYFTRKNIIAKDAKEGNQLIDAIKKSKETVKFKNEILLIIDELIEKQRKKD